MTIVSLHLCIYILLFVDGLSLQMRPSSTLSPSFSLVEGWVRRELSQVHHLKRHFLTELAHRNITSANYSSNKNMEGDRRRIATSTIDAPVECRLSLGAIPPGRKAVSPCMCTGTQKWVQLSSLNKARRESPKSWLQCNNCQHKYDFSFLYKNAPPLALAISSLLDNRAALRYMILASVALVSLPILTKITLTFLTSTFLWQQFPNWVYIYYFPIIVKLWLLQELVHYTSANLYFVENAFVRFLASTESNLIEASLKNDNCGGGNIHRDFDLENIS